MAENPFRSDPEIDPANQPNHRHKDYLVHAIYMVMAVLMGLFCAACTVTSTSIAGTVVCVLLALFMFIVAVRHHQLYRQGRQAYRANHPYEDADYQE